MSVPAKLLAYFFICMANGGLAMGADSKENLVGARAAWQRRGSGAARKPQIPQLTN